ncbi:MAG: hypothetical protein KGO49_11940 [Gammaproteobacteria bacterium]|nr:hypothetical protein [Gammaproteobacteria bacterium]
MSFIKIGVVLVVVAGAFVAVPLIWKMQSVQKREQIAALLPEKLRPHDFVDVSTQKITVYQSQGNKGEAVFSDRQNMANTARTRVVDNAKGTTTHIDVPKKEEKSSSSLNFNEENARFQKQAQQIQQARMERAIGE